MMVIWGWAAPAFFFGDTAFFKHVQRPTGTKKSPKTYVEVGERSGERCGHKLMFW